MAENGDMSQEQEIVVLSKDMQHLTESFKDLKDTLTERDVEIHNHINRKFSDEMTIGLLTLKNEMMKYTDDKVSVSVSEIKTIIKTWASLVVVVVAITVSVITYVNNRPAPVPATITQSSASEMAELFKIMMQENRKNVKQAQVIIEPERVIP